MFEALNTPIPSIDAYLTRISLQDMADTIRNKRDLNCLNQIICAHQMHVPFEDLDPYLYGKAPALEIENIYEKVVSKNRGGYCFELNALFLRLLQDLGYTAYAVFCRIVRGRDVRAGRVMPACLHRAVVVVIDGISYFCDVGYGGPMPPFAVSIANSQVTSDSTETYKIAHLEDNWWLLSRRNEDGSLEDILHFLNEPQQMSEFLPANYYCGERKESVFLKTLMVNRRTEKGNVSITDHTLTIREHGEKRQIELADETELKNALEKYFQIVL